MERSSINSASKGNRVSELFRSCDATGLSHFTIDKSQALNNRSISSWVGCGEEKIPETSSQCWLSGKSRAGCLKAL